MKHKNDSLRRIAAQLWVNPLCFAWALTLLSLTSIETHASEIVPVGGGTGSVISVSESHTRSIDHRLAGESKTHDGRPSLAEQPGAFARPLTTPSHEPVAHGGKFSLWIDQDTARHNVNLSLEDGSHYGPAPLQDGAVGSGSRSPLVPVSAPPSSGLLFATALVGMLGTMPVVRGESRFKRASHTIEFEPPRPCSPQSVVVLSSDAAVAGDLQKHLHGAGYEARIIAAVSEIFAVTDPASLLLIIVDRRTQDWDMLRTDPSLRHVLLMAVVPSGCLYTDDHFISDLERGIDGVHDLRDGHRLLVAKVGAYLRRAGRHDKDRGVYQVGAVELDGDAHEVKIAGRQVKLSAKPFAILTVLMREPSKIFSRSKLLDLVWGTDCAVCAHTVDVHVHALRQQLDREPNRLCELLTINRVGFTLRPVSSPGSIRTSRLRPISNFISDLHAHARMTPRLRSRRITPRTHRLSMGPPLNSLANTCMTSPCG